MEISEDFVSSAIDQSQRSKMGRDVSHLKKRKRTVSVLLKTLLKEFSVSIIDKADRL